MAISSTFETGVNGNNILTSDAGSPTPFDSAVVGTGTGALIKYDNVQKYGAMAGKIYAGSPPAGGNYIGWTTAFGTLTDHYGRMYLYYQNDWGSSGFVAFLSGTATRAAGFIRTSGLIELRDDSNLQKAITTISLTANAWNRIEWHLVANGTTGSFEMKIFVGANVDGTTPDETISATGLNTGINTDEVQFGILNGAVVTAWLDNLVAAATAYPGPYVSVTLDDCLPDADVTTTGWTTTPLFSKVNDASDATVIQATAV